MRITLDPIPVLIRRIAVPAALGFFFNTMFNVVDTFYTRFISTEALAGLSLSFPVFFILISMGHGLGSGIQGLVSNSLGREDKKETALYSLGGLSLSVVLAVILLIAGYLAAPWAFSLMGAQGLARQEGLFYINTILTGLIFFILNNAMNGILSARGDTKAFRNFLILGFFLNLGLDPLFIIVFDWGTRGLALATVLVQAVGTLYLGKKISHFHLLKEAKAYGKKEIIRTWPALIKQSIPASLNMMTIALGIFIINRFIVQLGGTPAVAGYGAAVRIEQVVLLPTIGLNIALVTLTGQNNGAGRPERVRQAYNLIILYGMIISAVGMGLLYFLREFWVGLFNSSPEVISAGAGYLKIEVLVIPAYALMSAGNSVLQGLKKPNMIFFVGIYRQILAPPVLFFLLGTSLGWGLAGIWWGIFFAVWSGAIVTLLYTRHITGSLIRQKPSATEKPADSGVVK